jgi:hypothetical protein
MVQQRRYQGPFAVTNGGDAVRIQNALVSPNTSQTDAWLLANVNYTNWYAYDTICEAVRNYDTWPSANKNAAWYFDTNYTSDNQYNGRFWTMPWDMTDTWGPTWNSGQDLAWNGIWGSTATIHTNLQRDYRNTMREIRDLLFQPDQINPLIDAVAARLAAIAPADLQRWSNCTPAFSSYASMALRGPAYTGGLPAYVQDMKDFMFTGGTRTWWVDRYTVGVGGWITRLDTLATDANIPTKPTIYYVGQTNYPMNSPTFPRWNGMRSGLREPSPPGAIASPFPAFTCKPTSSIAPASGTWTTPVAGANGRTPFNSASRRWISPHCCGPGCVSPKSCTTPRRWGFMATTTLSFSN